MSSFVPRVYQKLIISHILAHSRCALFVSMGMGKTSSTLAALEYLKITGEPVCALVLAPLRVGALISGFPLSSAPPGKGWMPSGSRPMCIAQIMKISPGWLKRWVIHGGLISSLPMSQPG